MEKSRLDFLLKEIESAGAFQIAVQNEKRIWVEIDRDSLHEFCRFIKDLGFDHLSCIVGIDRKDYLEVVYHAWSYIHRVMISARVKLPADDPVIDSVTDIWGSADWHEREAFDMFGVIFSNHPKLKRILLPEDFKGFPLRKEFQLKERDWI